MAKTSLHTHTAVARLPGVSWAFLYYRRTARLYIMFTVTANCATLFVCSKRMCLSGKNWFLMKIEDCCSSATWIIYICWSTSSHTTHTDAAVFNRIITFLIGVVHQSTSWTYYFYYMLVVRYCSSLFSVRCSELKTSLEITDLFYTRLLWRTVIY